MTLKLNFSSRDKKRINNNFPKMNNAKVNTSLFLQLGVLFTIKRNTSSTPAPGQAIASGIDRK
ncbi:MAG: hypothetical protein PHW84_02070, partial [Methanosarcina sp.]|nr:hypothetical protein [Methanosarcina sp.]